MYYDDGEGDLCSITNEMEIQEAVRIMKENEKILLVQLRQEDPMKGMVVLDCVDTRRANAMKSSLVPSCSQAEEKRDVNQEAEEVEEAEETEEVKDEEGKHEEHEEDLEEQVKEQGNNADDEIDSIPDMDTYQLSEGEEEEYAAVRKEIVMNDRINPRLSQKGLQKLEKEERKELESIVQLSTKQYEKERERREKEQIEKRKEEEEEPKAEAIAALQGEEVVRNNEEREELFENESSVPVHVDDALFQQIFNGNNEMNSEEQEEQEEQDVEREQVKPPVEMDANEEREKEEENTPADHNSSAHSSPASPSVSSLLPSFFLDPLVLHSSHSVSMNQQIVQSDELHELIELLVEENPSLSSHPFVIRMKEERQSECKPHEAKEVELEEEEKQNGNKNNNQRKAKPITEMGTYLKTESRKIIKKIEEIKIGEIVSTAFNGMKELIDEVVIAVEELKKKKEKKKENNSNDNNIKNSDNNDSNLSANSPNIPLLFPLPPVPLPSVNLLNPNEPVQCKFPSELNQLKEMGLVEEGEGREQRVNTINSLLNQSNGDINQTIQWLLIVQ